MRKTKRGRKLLFLCNTSGKVLPDSVSVETFRYVFHMSLYLFFKIQSFELKDVLTGGWKGMKGRFLKESGNE